MVLCQVVIARYDARTTAYRELRPILTDAMGLRALATEIPQREAIRASAGGELPAHSQYSHWSPRAHCQARTLRSECRAERCGETAQELLQGDPPHSTGVVADLPAKDGFCASRGP